MYLLVLAILIAFLIYIFFSGEAQRSLEEKRNTIVKRKKDCEPVIVDFQGQKYDITSFLKKHPGGAEILRENNGKDIETLMMDNDHSNKAYQILEKYKIN
jgi:cytochrome b involved in lipid metabolism